MKTFDMLGNTVMAGDTIAYATAEANNRVVQKIVTIKEVVSPTTGVCITTDKQLIGCISERGVLLPGIYATDRKAKAKYMFEQGICIDVMIDDNPSSWTTSMVPSTGGTW